MTVICITGTPGTGKTEVAKALAQRLGWMLVSLNDLAESKDLYAGYDEERECRIVDEDKVNKELDRIGEMHNLIAESHYAHEMKCDWVVILRTSPAELRERLKKKGWKPKKVEENVLAELMEVCKSEALERGRRMIEVDTTGKEAGRVADEIVSQLKKRKVIDSVL
jgi:adenylate kinase